MDSPSEIIKYKIYLFYVFEQVKRMRDLCRIGSDRIYGHVTVIRGLHPLPTVPELY